MDSDNFNDMFGDFDEISVVYEEMTKVLVPIFKGFVKNGLSVQEAAALTAAIIAQGMPQPAQKPQED